MIGSRPVAFDRDDGTTLVVGSCIFCQKRQQVEVPTGPFNEWRFHRSAGIQDLLPDLSWDQREFLISGICGPCFDETFKENEDIEEDE